MAKLAKVVTLPADAVEHLRDLLRRGHHNGRVLSRARILLKLHAQTPIADIVSQVEVSLSTVARVKRLYLTDGLDRALYDAPRSGAPPKISKLHEADVTVIACSEPPAGREEWTVRLIADRLVELGYTEGVSKTSVHTILKKVNLNLGRKNTGASES